MVTGIKIVTVGDGASMEKGHKWSAWNVSLCGGGGFGVCICEKSSSCKLKIRDRNWMYAILWGEKNLALKHFILNTDLRHYVPILIPSLSITTARRGSHGLPNTFKRACRKMGYDLLCIPTAPNAYILNPPEHPVLGHRQHLTASITS